MAEGKNSFVFRLKWKRIFDELDEAQSGKLIKHLLSYVSDENPDTDNPMLKIAFATIKYDLKEDLKKWEDIKEKRSEAGKKGGRPKAKEAKKANGLSKKQNEAKKAVSVSVSVSEDVLSKEREKKTRAIDFLKNNFPSRFETEFQMEYSNKIKNKEKFVKDFNDTVDLENLEYTDRVLFARLGKYARNWVENQNKFNGNQNKNDVDNFYNNIPEV